MIISVNEAKNLAHTISHWVREVGGDRTVLPERGGVADTSKDSREHIEKALKAIRDYMG